VQTEVGRSAHGTAPLFFRWSMAQIHSWKGLGGRGPGNVAPETLPVFFDLPRSLVALASRPIVHVTKHHKAACGFCFVIRSAL